MTNEEAIEILSNKRNDFNYGEYEQAKKIAIECIEKCEHLIDDTLEMVREYIDDCICTYDAELFGRTVPMIPVETVHQLLERIGEEAKESDNE